MAVLLLEKDPFVELSQSLETSSFGDYNVRRPLYGISTKKDRFAFLAVYQVSPTGQTRAISLLDSSAPGGHSKANHNFLLQSVQESRQERAQIVETFGDHFVFFYGEKPILLQCGGVLINTRDFNWKNEWLRNYDQYLRGTKCVEYQARIYMGFDDVLVEGYLLSTGVQMTAQEMPYFCPFNFTLLVSRYTDLSRSLNVVVTSGNGTNVVDGKGVGARITASGKVVEYLAGQQATAYETVDPATGEVKEQSSVFNNGNIPMSINDGQANSRSASWITGGRSRRQWKRPDEALLDIDRDLTTQQTGADAITVRRSQLSSGGSFPLGTRSSSSSSLAASLTTGVANGAMVVSDPPSV